MKQKYTELISSLGEKRIKLNEPLSTHTYIKIGGPADLFFEASNLKELKLAVTTAQEVNLPYVVLGGGSNILLSDKGYRGLVIKNKADGIKIEKKGKVKAKNLIVDKAGVYAESGVLTNLLVRRTIAEELAGLEYFLGIPGTIGGAIYNNSHFKKQLISDLVSEVVVLDKQGVEKTYTKDQMQFSYDYSILQQTHEVILSVTFLLKKANSPKLWLKAEEFAKYRTATQPLNYPSSGCIFKNIKILNANSPLKKVESISAGYLIEKAGLKGISVGKAEVSSKHANFIINTGGATAKDVLDLIALVKRQVKKKFNYNLEAEIFQIGEF